MKNASSRKKMLPIQFTDLFLNLHKLQELMNFQVMNK